MRIQFFPYPFLLGLFILALILPLAWRKSHSRAYVGFFALFSIYLLLVVGITLFPMPIPIDMGGTLHRQPLWLILSRVNTIPFRYLTLLLPPSGGVSFELVGNILLTIPFGFGLHFITRIRARHFLWIAFAVGLGIETAQFIATLVVGFGYRAADITDVLLNAAGVLCGYALFRLFAWLVVRSIHALRIQPKGLLRYVYAVSRRPEPRSAPE